MKGDEVLVSVAMITYNHEKFIRKALDSVLEQKSNFEFEIVIGDDCSPDGTSMILKEYKKRYPEKIKIFLNNENVGPTRNVYNVLSECKGKYVAILEGDDYWCDENKLSKQVSYLEEHREIPAVFGTIKWIDEEGNPLKRSCNAIKCIHECTLLDYALERAIPGHIGTVMFRNFFLNKDKDFSILYTAHDFRGDMTLYYLMLNQGKTVCLDTPFLCYRFVCREGATNWNSVASKRDLTMDTLQIAYKIIVWTKEQEELSELGYYWLNKLLYLSIRLFLKTPKRDYRVFMSQIFNLHDRKLSFIPFMAKWILFRNKAPEKLI